MVQYILQQSSCILQQCLKQRHSFRSMHRAGVGLGLGKTVNDRAYSAAIYKAVLCRCLGAVLLKVWQAVQQDHLMRPLPWTVIAQALHQALYSLVMRPQPLHIAHMHSMHTCLHAASIRRTGQPDTSGSVLLVDNHSCRETSTCYCEEFVFTGGRLCANNGHADGTTSPRPSAYSAPQNSKTQCF